MLGALGFAASIRTKMPLYMPVGDIWLNMAKSVERVLKRRALDN